MEPKVLIRWFRYMIKTFANDELPLHIYLGHGNLSPFQLRPIQLRVFSFSKIKRMTGSSEENVVQTKFFKTLLWLHSSRNNDVGPKLCNKSQKVETQDEMSSLILFAIGNHYNFVSAISDFHGKLHSEQAAHCFQFFCKIQFLFSAHSKLSGKIMFFFSSHSSAET